MAAAYPPVEKNSSYDPSNLGLSLDMQVLICEECGSEGHVMIADGSYQPACQDGCIMLSSSAEYTYAVQVCEGVQNQGACHDC